MHTHTQHSIANNSITSASPFFLRDGSGNSVNSTGVVRLARDVPAKDGAHKIKRQHHKYTDTGHCQLQKGNEKGIAATMDGARGYHGEDWDSPGGMVVNGNKIDEEGSATDQSWQEPSSTHHLTDPGLAWSTGWIRRTWHLVQYLPSLNRELLQSSH